MDVCVFLCVLDNSAIAEPLTVRPFIFILVNETLSVCKIKGSLQRHTVVVFQRNVLKGFQKVQEENIRRNRLFSFLLQYKIPFYMGQVKEILFTVSGS